MTLTNDSTFSSFHSEIIIKCNGCGITVRLKDDDCYFNYIEENGWERRELGINDHATPVTMIIKHYCNICRWIN